MKTKIASLSVLAALSLAIGPSGASAQDPICIPNAAGVPGDPGAPDFFSYSFGDPAPVPDDPRWRGALALGRAGEQLLVRTLRRNEGGETHLYFSVSTPIGPGIAAPDSLPAEVRLAFQDPASGVTEAVVFDFEAGPDTDAPSGTHPATFDGPENTVTHWTHDGAAWSFTSGAPAWVGTTPRVWGECTGSLCGWTLQFRVQIGSDPGELDLGDDFRLWLHALTPLTATNEAEYTWPAGVDAPATFGDVISTEFDEWQDMRRSGSPCAGGISIDPLQISVEHPGTPHPEDNRIRDTNAFHARPTNATGAPVAADGIEAHFRIANWGSAVGDSPEWRTVGGFGTNCDEATGSGPDVSGDPSSPGAFDLGCTWDPTDSELCQYGVGSDCDGGTPTFQTHQCVLVELSGTTASGTLVFSRASAYRNMDVVGASHFERVATISIRGLEALPTGDRRDVYLAVTRAAMPTVEERRAALEAEGEEGAEGEQGEPAGSNRQGARGTRSHIEGATSLQPMAEGSGSDPRALPPIRVRASTQTVQAIREGRTRLEDAVGELPTYIVHVFHDTGRRVELAGEERALLAAQPSFGYFVQHDGPFYGWATNIEGAEEIAPDLYRISVPEGGARTVKTIIEAVEELDDIGTPPSDHPAPPEPSPSGWQWWHALLLGLLLLLLLAGGVWLSERE